MIDEVDQRLKDWVGTIIDGAEISLTLPRQLDGKRIVSLYLMDFLHSPPVHGTRRLPLQVSLRYLITAWADPAEEEHRMLAALVFAAMEHADFDVELKPVSAELWNALNVVPRPSFLLRVPLRLERPEPKIALVKTPPEVRYSPTTSLEGLVLGPGEIPLADARVELPTVQLSTRTDSKGRFRFARVPAEPRTKRFRIMAKGKELSLALDQPGNEKETLIINFDVMEV